MYQADKIKTFQKQWESISRKSIKGFVFKDFQQDIGALINANVFAEENVQDVINSDLRKVLQTISGSSGTGEIVCLADLKEFFALKVDYLKHSKGRFKGSHPGREAGLSQEGFGSMELDTKPMQMDTESQASQGVEYASRQFASLEEMEASFTACLEYLCVMYQNICNSQDAYIELMFGMPDKGSDGQLTQLAKKQAEALPPQPYDRKRLRSAVTKTTKAGWINPNSHQRSSEFNLSHHSLVVSAQGHTQDVRPVIRAAAKPHTVNIAATKSSAAMPWPEEVEQEDIVSQIEKANNYCNGPLRPASHYGQRLGDTMNQQNSRPKSSILNFAFDIDNNQHLYKKSGQHKLGGTSVPQNRSRPKSALPPRSTKPSKKRQGNSIQTNQVTLSKKEEKKLGATIMKGVQDNQQICRLNTKSHPMSQRDVTLEKVIGSKQKELIESTVQNLNRK